MKLREEDYRKAVHLIKSIGGQYRKRGFTPEEIREHLKKHISDILYFRTIYNGRRNIEIEETGPYHVALQLLK